jgi:hypothetical protein
MGDQPVVRPLPTHRINVHRHPCFEQDSKSQLSFVRTKTVHALDHAVTVIGFYLNMTTKMSAHSRCVTPAVLVIVLMSSSRQLLVLFVVREDPVSCRYSPSSSGILNFTFYNRNQLKNITFDNKTRNMCTYG